MVENFVEHLTRDFAFPFFLVLTGIASTFAISYFYKQNKRYGSFFDFASGSAKFLSSVSILGFVGLLVYGVTPYIEPPTSQIAIVIGDTQNTPRPSLLKGVSDSIESTLLQHKGESVKTLEESVVFVSATGNPKVLDVNDANLKLREIGNNSSNAKRSASLNVAEFEKYVATTQPFDNGSNYLEAILKAKDNVNTGAKIVVIGSGLSDSGDLNFSHTNILTNESERAAIADKIEDKYGNDELEGYTIELYGLGDTVLPQEPLSTMQKNIVRDIYKDVLRSLGAEVVVNTQTLNGEGVQTSYIVGTTDTGCGQIGLVFDDSKLKFQSNLPSFVDSAGAQESLTSVKLLWDKYSDTIDLIQVDGYIARYGTVDTLSQPRADSVKDMLVGMGIPSDVINSTGRGFGPYPLDVQNRIVKVTIVRDGKLCGN